MSARTFMLPNEGHVVHRWLLDDLRSTQRRLRLVCFLPPCAKLARALEATAERLPAGAVEALVDGSTATSLNRHDAAWMRRLVVRGGGTVHAKALLADDVLWWGSWNMSVTALRQPDIVQRVEGDPELVARVLAWMDGLPLLCDEVACGSKPRGAYTTAAGLVDTRDAALRADPNYDPDLGF